VVTVAWEHLSKAQRPINYLRALLRSTADFAWQARNKRQATAKRHEADQEALRIATVVQRTAGEVFSTAIPRDVSAWPATPARLPSTNAGRIRSARCPMAAISVGQRSAASMPVRLSYTRVDTP
jgi:hypothetical protein